MIGSPPVAIEIFSARSGPSISTTSAPFANKSFSKPGRRTTLMVFMPRCFANWITYPPTAEFEALWIIHCPSLRSINSVSIRKAVIGLTIVIDNCSIIVESIAPISGKGRNCEAGATISFRHVPFSPPAKSTNCPTFKYFTSDEISKTLPIPSLPGVDGNMGSTP